MSRVLAWWARRVSQKKIYLRPYQSIQGARSESKSCPKIPGRILIDTKIETPTRYPPAELQAAGNQSFAMPSCTTKRREKSHESCKGVSASNPGFRSFLSALTPGQARRMNDSQTISCSLACFTIFVLCRCGRRRNAAARCGGAAVGFPFPWVLLGYWFLFVLHNRFGRGWRVVGLFDDGGAREEDGTKDGVLAWRG